jgi:signal transduction histidine kinase/CHASE1-domain containing sensor protein
VPLVVLGVSLLATAAIHAIASQYVEYRDQIRVENEISKIEGAILARMSTYQELLRTTTASFETEGIRSPREFRRYVEAIEVVEAYPGIQSFGFAYWAEEADREKTLALLRRQIRPDYRVFPTGSGPWALVSIAYPITDSTRKAIGFNMWSEKQRREAMANARRERTITLSGKVYPPSDPDRLRPSFILYSPVFRPGLNDAPRLAGFLYGTFRAHRFFPTVFTQRSGLEMWVRVYDGEHIEPDGFLFSNVPDRYDQPVLATRVLQVMGHAWTIEYVPQASIVESGGGAVVRWIPLLGLVVGFLLAGLSFGQVRTNEALMRQAIELERREMHQGLLARVSAALANSHEIETTLRLVAEIVVPRFAERCEIALLDKDGREHIAARVPPPALPSGHDVCEVPIEVRDEMCGRITFVAAAGQRFDEEDVRLAEQIAARAAVAYDGAELNAAREREIEVRRAAEQRVREVNENLERLVEERTRELVAANTELEAFCYSVSHDLRGPLRSVDGFSRALLEDYGSRLDAEGHEFIDRVRRAARRMDELITALLSLSRVTRAELNVGHLDFTALAEEVARDSLRPEEGKAEFVVQPAMTAKGDPRMIRIVLDNLIANALKFSATREKPRIEIGQENGAFFVRDNGVGFNPQYKSKLFAPFERLHATNEYPGTGIGLATVQRIVARHGGTVWADGQENVGATFYFTLPSDAASGSSPL